MRDAMLGWFMGGVDFTGFYQRCSFKPQVPTLTRNLTDLLLVSTWTRCIHSTGWGIVKIFWVINLGLCDWGLAVLMELWVYQFVYVCGIGGRAKDFGTGHICWVGAKVKGSKVKFLSWGSTGPCWQEECQWWWTWETFIISLFNELFCGFQ